MKTFGELFKKYRLKAEFETFTEFGEALAKKGYYYEESIFSRWQKGTRMPANRTLILKLIEIFVEREAIQTIDKANEFLGSLGLSYLTDKEIQILQLKKTDNSPFQVPTDIVHFTGRKEIIKKITREITKHSIFLLQGAAGVGKTALAIKLGHQLRNKFPDGVLWYKVDSSNVMDILLSIARLFGEDISTIKDPQVRASIVRTLLEKRKVLLIFDNVTNKHDLYLLLPSTKSCCVIFSSQEVIFTIGQDCRIVNLSPFTENEVVELFDNIFGKEKVKKYKKIILSIGEKLGNLPLALHVAAHIVATYPKDFSNSLKKYLAQLDVNAIDLQSLTYEDKNFFKAIQIGFDTLEDSTKNVFISLGVFEGKDFSLEAVAAINKQSPEIISHNLRRLHMISFIDQSENGRYRIHPLMKLFARKKMTNFSFFLNAAKYYEQLFIKTRDTHSHKTLIKETDNMIYIFKKCYDAGYWDQIVTLWNPLENFLSSTNEIKKIRSLAETIDTAPRINNLQKATTGYLIFVLIYWVVLAFSGLKNSNWNNGYFIYNFIPFIGGFVGIFRSKSWGFLSTTIGKAIFFISAGLFSWGSGNFVWAYYNFFQNIIMPYPSFADVGYFLGALLWIVGIVYLAQATGAKFSLKHNRIKLFLCIIPVIIITLSYYFLLFVIKRTFASEDLIKIFFDLAYPSLDIIILTIAILIFGLSVNFFRGKYRLSLFAILGGFVGMYIADFYFSYITTLPEYVNGSLPALLYTFATYLLTMGTLSFYVTPKKK